MWNVRYAQEFYVYGEEPNKFFRDKLDQLPVGKLLLPAEGEGRNAVYAASKGWDVVAFDSSIEAIKKAKGLAFKNKVEIDYRLATFEEIELELNSFDAIAFIFAHNMPRKENHQKMLRFLKSGAAVILEGFSKNQLNYSSGGPRNLNLLFSSEELKSDFGSLSTMELQELMVDLNEGSDHRGMASVIRLLGVK
ncbi:MAG: class I SAM-dependent methyltransferase [Bacteroidales bacterium]|nr:class I SAM-dependent methyltransferase [Bacteroidales bacterium]